MAIKQEMFRFVSTRRAERAMMRRIAGRLIRDRRRTTRESMLFRLFGPGLYDTRLVIANTFAASRNFVAPDAPAMLALEPVAAFFRERLRRGVPLAELAGQFRDAFPLIAALLDRAPPDAVIEAASGMTARLWDSFYAQTIRGCDRYVSTNYLADGLRVYHVCRMLWMSLYLGLDSWYGATFDEYDTLIDLESARSLDEGKGRSEDPAPPPRAHEELRIIAGRLEQIDAASTEADRLIGAGALNVSKHEDGQSATFDDDAVQLLRTLPALEGMELQSTPAQEVLQILQRRRETAVLERERTFSALVDPQPSRSARQAASQALALQPQQAPQAASLAPLSASGSVFRVPLSVGTMKPPSVGDLLIVEQELRRYERGELADIESIMRGERRERTIRKLNRTSQTTTTESSFEQEESNSLKTDERFQLSSQAQKAAEQSFGLDAGVTASSKFGPVQVSTTVNASFDTSKSSSESTSQEFARTVTEEASKRVKSSFKESTSITILSETQDTSLRGFNNEAGASHVNGMYRWVDKIYDAQLVNYGRRLMFALSVPEPAAAYRFQIDQDQAAVTAGLVEPRHPSRISRSSVTPLPGTGTTGGFRSHQDIDEGNYARLAALYDVSVQSPPTLYLTGSKAYAHPEAMQAQKMDEHDFGSDPSYMTSDNSLAVDPGYRITHLAVFAPEGPSGDINAYVDALKMGEDNAGKVNVLLVKVAHKDFFLTATAGNDGKVVRCNFNEWADVTQDGPFGELVQPSIPVTITALFEGMLTLTVAYKAMRTDEAMDAWRSGTYAAIIKGYNARKQAYDQARAIAESKAQAVSDKSTFQLRDSQYRSIELTELKRCCIDLFSAGTATGHTSIAVATDGTPRIVHDPAEGASIPDWRSPLANGSVADFFELAFEWENVTYQFHPYYWAGRERWKGLAQAAGADPVFEQFLRAGNASVVVPVRPGFERPAMLFLKTGLIWGGGYLSLFTNQDMLDVYADVELGRQFDPPLEIGDPWEIRLPTNMVMLQQDEELPEFPREAFGETSPELEEPVPDESVPF